MFVSNFWDDVRVLQSNLLRCMTYKFLKKDIKMIHFFSIAADKYDYKVDGLLPKRIIYD